VRPVQSLDELAAIFDPRQLSHAPARFDEAELRALSARTLHETPFARIAPRLAALGIDGPDTEAFWRAVHGNLSRLEDAKIWRRVIDGPVEPVVEDSAFLEAAAATLPAEPFDARTWSNWTAELKKATGRKGRELFHPLRLALTGLESGPELAQLLPLIGRARASDRLRGRAS